MPLLLATKFHTPAPPVKPVHRQRLLQRLNDGLAAGRLLTLVSAPAGFGKTTCVSAWIAGVDLPVAWLSLDAADDEPGRFFTYFIAALQKVDPALGQEIDGVLRAGQIPPGEVVSDALLNDLLARGKPFLLVLDDLHVIQDRQVLGMLEHLLTGLARTSSPVLHLVLLSREDPPLPLARLRANNRLTEIRAGDLRFSGPEAERFLNAAMALNLPGDEIAALEERTEGWIVGLQLAALALQSRAGQPAAPAPAAGHTAFIAELGGSQHAILSYLAEEVLSREPQDIQRFLLETSILDALSGDLCDAVCAEGAADASRGADLLEQLYRANLFLVPLDDAHRWFRYHHLFAGLLRERLAALGKERAAELHRRASRWYAAHGGAYVEQAIEHALAAADYAFAVQHIENHAMGYLMQWQTKTVNTWMEELPPEWAAKSPRTNLAFAWLHLMSGNPAQALPYLERLGPLFSGSGEETAVAPQVEPSLLAEWLALQAMLSNAQAKPDEAMALAQRALENLPRRAGQAPPGAFDRGSYVLTMIYTDLAASYQQLGDFERAMDAYQKIIEHGQQTGDVSSQLMGISALGLLVLQRGQLHLLYQLTAQGEEIVKGAGATLPISQAVYGELGEVYYEWNDLERARDYYQRAARASALCGFPDAEIYNTVFSSRLNLRWGNLEAAARQIEQAVSQMQVISPTAVREEVVAQQVRVLLAQRRLADAEAALKLAAARQKASTPGYTSPPESPRLSEAPGVPGVPAGFPDLQEGQGLPYPYGQMVICTLRILLHRAAQRGELANLPAGIALADRLIDAALQRHYVPLAITALLLRGQMAAVQDSTANRASARADFARALALAEPEGAISIIVEEGLPVARALKDLLESGELGGVSLEYVEKLLDAFTDAPPSSAPGAEQAPPAALVEPLTERELEVLRLIAEGLKYQEIADRLYISLNTVRTYVKEIYSKLNVNNRTSAITLARQYRLIE